jgi:GT2 family glycosyltransferase
MNEAAPIDVSIIIVNWNTREILRECLCSVFAETHGVGFEVIVIDNASSDNSVEMVRDEFPGVHLIANTKNVGFAAANNQGMAVACGRYMLLLNSDTIVLDRAIQKTIAFADVHPDTAVVGCRVLNPDRSLQNTCFMFPSILNWFLFSTYLYKLFPRSRFFGRERMTWWLREDAREVDVVTGCFMLVRGSAIAEVGLMDDEFFMYAEETDWCYRFKCGDWKNRFTPDAVIIHIGGASARKLSARRARITNASFTRYMFKHWSRPRAYLGMVMILFFYAVRLLAVGPKQLLKPNERDRQLLKNHGTGFKDMLKLISSRDIHCPSSRLLGQRAKQNKGGSGASV